MKTILTVLKKELRRFFTDSRMLISIFLPGVLIYVIYSLLGGVMTDMTAQEITNYTIYVENEPLEFANMYDKTMWTINKNPESLTKDEILVKIKEGTVDLYIIYEEGFFDKINNSLSVPNVEIYFNSTKESSVSIHAYTTAYLDAYEEGLSNIFNVNSTLDLATNEDISVQIIGMILPFILVTFLLSGAMGICSESIAGEKERGTIATLLVTPVKRSDLVVGKISALGITTIVSAFVSFLGLILSIPKLAGTEFNLNVYGIDTLALLLLVVIITALLFTTLLTIVSTYAKSVKEATTLSSPILIVVTIIGMTGMMATSANTNLLMYLIPIYNSIQSLTGILNQSYNIWAILITVGVNIGVISLGVYLLTKMFNSEKIMFNK